MRDSGVDRVVVVVPARDEEDTIEAAVAAVQVAATLVAPRPVEMVVVANGCSDATAHRAARAGAQVLVSGTASVGAARALGVATVLGAGHDLDHTWISTSDADSVVPPGWLQAQVAAAERGADLFLGTVELEPAEAERHRGWVARYALGRPASGHGHVHGASLGVRASVYARVGGFTPLEAHEDVDLVHRLLAAGARPEWAVDVPVRTSARHRSRVLGGVGSDLAASALEAQP